MTPDEARAKQEEAAATWPPRFTEKGEQIEPLLIIETSEGLGTIENPEYTKSSKLLP